MFCINTDCPDFLATGFHAEFRPGITVCPSCGARLEESLEPPEEDHRPSDATAPDADADADADGDLWAALEGLELPCELEPVMETASVDEIMIIRSMLDGAWIPSVVTPRERVESGATHDGAQVRDGMELVVLVPVDLADEARERLEELGDE